MIVKNFIIHRSVRASSLSPISVFYLFVDRDGELTIKRLDFNIFLLRNCPNLIELK